MDTICMPLLLRIPESVHPNTISLVTHFISWTTLFLAYYAWRLSPGWRTICIIGVAVGLIGTITGDYLDGMQARRTNRCSKLGEMMDHWLDTIGAPLNTAAIALAMQLPFYILAPMHIANVMIYNAQLVHYHHTGVFVHPKSSGSGGLFQSSILLVALAFLFLYFGRENYWVDIFIVGLGVVGIILMCGNLLFFYVRLKNYLIKHVYFILYCLGFATLYIFGVIDTLLFLLTIVFLSFRINGSYVMSTIIDQKFNGTDLSLAVWLTAIFLSNYFGMSYTVAGLNAPTVLTYLVCMYIVIYNIYEFTHHFSKLTSVKS